MKVRDRLVQSFSKMHKDMYETKKAITTVNTFFAKYKNVIPAEDYQALVESLTKANTDNNKVIAEFEELTADLKIWE